MEDARRSRRGVGEVKDRQTRRTKGLVGCGEDPNFLPQEEPIAGHPSKAELLFTRQESFLSQRNDAKVETNCATQASRLKIHVAISTYLTMAGILSLFAVIVLIQLRFNKFIQQAC